MTILERLKKQTERADKDAAKTGDLGSASYSDATCDAILIVKEYIAVLCVRRESARNSHEFSKVSLLSDIIQELGGDLTWTNQATS